MLKKLRVIFPKSIKRPVRKMYDSIRYRVSVSSLKRVRRTTVSENPKLLFLVVFPEMWNSLKPVYNAALNKGYDLSIVALPVIRDGVVSECSRSARFFDAEGIKYISAYSYETGQWIDIESLEPNFVFYTRPYNSEYPGIYKTTLVSRYATTCFLPYGYLDVFKWHFDIVYNYDFMSGVNFVFPGQKSVKEALEKKYHYSTRKGFLAISNLNYVRFELAAEQLNRLNVESDSINILWTPRWAVKNNQNLTTFFKYSAALIDYVKDNQDFSLVLRPHPIAFDNFVKEGCMTENEVRIYKENLNRTHRFACDENDDYLLSFNRSDVLISDSSSLILEYVLSGKPIVYTGEFEGLSKESRMIYSALYIANDWEDIVEVLENLSKGIDEKKNQRIVARNILLPDSCVNIGEAVLAEIFTPK